ncbi:hypothetical protein NDU88_004916 [Pleurodeles waltl]|uniref:Uncharacterized protein n=1 Tax=Pleurodeles waltl TaxID=8319 RepID=A0AAV7M8U8_PLEWA|nr:hypothetical protein NDU88_004916 [Pleurodeles waltl]
MLGSGRCAGGRPWILPGPRCGLGDCGGEHRAGLTGEEAGGPSPHLEPRAAAEVERTARVQRGTLPGSPCCERGTGAAGGGPRALGGLRPENDNCGEHGEAGAALSGTGAGPQMEWSAWPGRGTAEKDWRGGPCVGRGPSDTPIVRGR